MAQKIEKVKQRQKRGVFVWLKRIGIGGIFFILLLLLSAYVFQAYTTSNAIRRYPPPGQLVDIGGYRLHFQSSGSGSPVVVLDAGLGAPGVAWALVQPEVAKFTQVISYDRAGLGWSDRGPKDRTRRQIVKELHAILKQAEIPGPYVLVGASAGGGNVRLFAHEYPDLVAGMVLVDAGHEEEYMELPESSRRLTEASTQRVKLAYFLAPFGISRLARFEIKELPPEPRAVRLALDLRTPGLMTACEEWFNVRISQSQMKGCTMPSDIPLAILSASKSDEPKIPTKDQLVVKNIHNKYQKVLASQSTNSFLYVVPDSGHAIQFERPDVVVDSIKRVVESVRNKTKLISPNQ